MATEPIRHERPSQPQAEHGEISITEDLTDYLQEYARQKPEVVAIWSFAIGFILGWKLKPW